jgi:hypothetical protein
MAHPRPTVTLRSGPTSRAARIQTVSDHDGAIPVITMAIPVITMVIPVITLVIP